MANFELDPLFVKALRLLHSKAKDSTEQLKQLLDDGLHHHTSSSIYGQEPLKLTNYGSKKLSAKQALEPPQQPPSKKISNKEDDTKRKDAEKRTFDKLKQEVEVVPEIKKSRLEKIVIRTPSPAFVVKDEDSSDDNTSATDIALEMGLACVVCKSFDVAPGNTLVECQDCHSLYHQECHKPLITDHEVNDPRLVWYCAKCTKNMRKMASKNQKASKPVVPASTKESNIVGKPSKPEPVVAPLPQTHIFKRAEPKVTGTVSSTSSTTSGNKPIGLAGLAASLSGKSHQAQKASQPSTGKSLPSLKTSSSGTSATKQSTTQSTSGGIKSNQFSNLILSSKTSSQSSTSSSSTAVQTPTTPTSNTGSAGSSFLPVKSSSASTLVTTSTPKTTSSTSAGGNGSSSSNALSSKSPSSSSMMSADKRLQIMKKKAAAKMQEKRRLSTK